MSKSRNLRTSRRSESTGSRHHQRHATSDDRAGGVVWDESEWPEVRQHEIVLEGASGSSTMAKHV